MGQPFFKNEASMTDIYFPADNSKPLLQAPQYRPGSLHIDNSSFKLAIFIANILTLIG
jgi:hypothetical protein